jgi:23S rRNA (guanine2445-N2)-methyltransferase / 23S rRNA (guanine2069-N7)-methyltransferase
VSELNFFVTCPKGLEYLLEDELQTFGMEPVQNAPAGVWANGTLEAGYRACMWSRLANRVILHLADVDATSADKMLGGVTDLPWEDHVPVTGSLRVNFVGQNDEIRNTQFGAQRVKDGIVDRLRTASGQRPSVDAKDPDVTVSARLHRVKLSVGIELSGDSLHKRGYRTEKGAAPLKENLAAALLIRCGWPEIAKAGGDFLDPMCGSGTLVIEAAMMAMDIAPGRKRERWGFTRWPGHDAELWLQVRQEAERRAHDGRQAVVQQRIRFTGSDQDPRVIATARNNVQRAGLGEQITLETRDIAALTAEPDQRAPGLVLVNPPYGERLSELKELGGLYQSLGEAVKGALPGWRLGVFTGAPEYGKSLGLRSYKQYRLYNGKLPAQLLLFSVDQASARTSRAPDVPGQITPRITNQDRADMLRNRLKKNMKTIGQWARKQGIGCYRLYDADMPEFALAIDIYEGRAHVQEYMAPKSVDERSARERLAEAIAVIPDAIGIEASDMVCKQRQRQTGLNQYEKQEASGEFFTVHEHGCALKVNLKDYLDTGLFLDHRPVRQWIQHHAAGKRFLNLFCYTGVATVHAAVGGASRSLSLDMSKTYVKWAQENLTLNGADLTHHRVEQADCLQWLAEKPGSDQRFDLIFMDPPTFSNSARMAGVLDIQKDHARLINQAMQRLTSEGRLIFSTNFRRFKLDESLEADFAVDEVSRDTLDKDFQRNARIHRCWHIQHKI